MEIPSYISAYSNNIAASGSTARVSDGTTLSSTATPSSGGDTVSISDEARELFGRKTQMLEGGGTGVKKLNSTGTEVGEAVIPESAVKSAEDEKKAASGGGGSSEASSEEAEQIKEIENQIKELSAQLASILGGAGGGETDAKMVQAAPLQQKIAVLQAQLQGLQSKMGK